MNDKLELSNQDGNLVTGDINDVMSLLVNRVPNVDRIFINAWKMAAIDPINALAILHQGVAEAFLDYAGDYIQKKENEINMYAFKKGHTCGLVTAKIEQMRAKPMTRAEIDAIAKEAMDHVDQVVAGQGGD